MRFLSHFHFRKRVGTLLQYISINCIVVVAERATKRLFFPDSFDLYAMRMGINLL